MVQATIINWGTIGVYDNSYALSTHSEYATADSMMRSDIRLFDSIVNLCLLRLHSQYVSISASRIRSNKWRFGPAYFCS